jgi:biopolymer transport protein ExbD
MNTIIVAVGLACSSFCVHNALAQNNIPGAIIASSGGRFVFGQMSGSGEDQYMLDTQTGHLWKREWVDGSLALVPVPYRAADATRTLLPPEEPAGVEQKPIVINVAAGGNFSLAREQFDLPRLSAKLKELGALQPKPAIIVRADKGPDYRHVTDVLDACRAAGLSEIAFATATPK